MMGYTTHYTGQYEISPPLTMGALVDLEEILEEGFAGLNYGEIDFEINRYKTHLEHDGSENSYDSESCINALIEYMREKGHDFSLYGKLDAVGEDGEVWVEEAKGDHVVTYNPVEVMEEENAELMKKYIELQKKHIIELKKNNYLLTYLKK